MATQAEQSNIEIIFADWLDALRRGDTERMAARLTPDAIHQGILPDWTCHNREEILDQIVSRRSMLPSVEALELVAAGDHVVMSVRAPTIGPPTGEGDETPRGQACIVFTLKEGKIVRMQDYVHRADALEAAAVSLTWE